MFPPPPEEDSPNLTDADIASAQDTSAIEDIEKALQGFKCPTCDGEAFTGPEHTLLRHIPSLYWRIQMTCAQDHPITLFFKVDWLKR